MSLKHVVKFEETLVRVAPYMASTVPRQRETFGPNWEKRFDETLAKLFGDDQDRLERAVRGYVRFALDATKLQKRFEKDRQYITKTYDEAAQAVYHNAEYMHGLYLPGILLSHFLWPHHYRQLLWFDQNFMPSINASPDKRFCDVGVGTGFYSRQILAGSPEVEGIAFDISDHALEYSRRHIEAFGLSDRWRAQKRNILTREVDGTWPFLVSVEVLEHLEDPVTFLEGLRRLLAPGGYGFITAAITAPNEDHIYLYNDCREIIDQLTRAGFEVEKYLEEWAYEPKADEPVPRLGAFIVR